MKGNNILKQISKIFVPATMVFAFLCTPVTKLFTKITKVSAASNPELTDVEGANIQVMGFENTGIVGEEVKLPTVKIGNTEFKANNDNTTSDLYYEVKSPAGKTVVTPQEKTGTDSYYYFVPTQEGVYTVNIYTQYDGKLNTVVNNLQINVEKAKVDFSVTTNAIVKSGATANVLPAKITLANLVSDNFKLDAPTLSEGADIANIKVTCIPAGKSSTNDGYVLEYNSQTNTYAFKAEDKATINTNKKYGTYTFKYSYVSNGVKLGNDITQTCEVTETNDFENDIKLALSTLVSSSELTSANIGEWVDLPTATVYNSNSGKTDSIPAILSIKITPSDAINGTDTVIEQKGYSFRANKIGTYQITYTATYPYTNKTVEKNYTISLKDEVNPEVILVNTYNRDTDYTATTTTPTEEGFVDYLLENKDASNMLQSVYVMGDLGGEQGMGVKIDIPAMYAKDNSTDGNYTLSRDITTANNSSVNIAEEPNKETFYTAKSEGVYTVYFRATDANGRATVAKRTMLVVSQDTLEELSEATNKEEITKPEIKTGTLPRSIASDKVLEFAMPTATDALTTAFKNRFTRLKSSSISWSSAVDITTTLQAYNNNDEAITAVKHVFTEEDVNSDNKYTLDMEEFLTGVTSVADIAYFKLTYTASTDWMTDLTITSSTKTSADIDFVYVEDDTTAPTIGLVEVNNVDTLNGLIYELNKTTVNSVIDGRTLDDATVIDLNGKVTFDDDSTTAPFNQYSSTNKVEVVLPDLIITDLEDRSNISVTGVITDEHNNTKTFLPAITKISAVTNTYQYYIEMGSHKLTTAGKHTVTITAVDKGGNISTYSYAVFVNDNTSPSDIVLDTDIIGDSTINKTYTVGEFIDFPEATVVDNVDDNIKYTATLTSYPANARITENQYNKGFKTLTAGTYEITYSCQDSSGNPYTKVYTLEVVDKNYTKIVVSDSLFPEDMRYAFDDTKTTNEIIIPFGVTVNTVDPTLNNIEVKPTVKNANNVTQTVTAKDDNYSFNAKQGVYTIEYKYGTVTKTFKIYVGDTDAPIIKWLEDVPTSLDLNAEWGKDIDKMFEISDIKNGEKSTLSYKSITITPPSGSSSSKITLTGDKNITFDKEGDYTLTITFTDGVNEVKETKTIKVASKTAEITNNTTNVVGTILLIASILVVGGVIVYLILSSKKSSKKNKN